MKALLRCEHDIISVDTNVLILATGVRMHSIWYMSCCQTDLMKKQTLTPIMLPLSTSPKSFMLAASALTSAARLPPNPFKEQSFAIEIYE